MLTWTGNCLISEERCPVHCVLLAPLLQSLCSQQPGLRLQQYKVPSVFSPSLRMPFMLIFVPPQDLLFKQFQKSPENPYGLFLCHLRCLRLTWIVKVQPNNGGIQRDVRGEGRSFAQEAG
jgi:hypothetical protein